MKKIKNIHPGEILKEEFLNEFPLCFVMHTVAVNYKKLEDSHIHRIIEELIEFS